MAESKTVGKFTFNAEDSTVSGPEKTRSSLARAH
jgi:hypothetical protein